MSGLNPRGAGPALVVTLLLALPLLGLLSAVPSATAGLAPDIRQAAWLSLWTSSLSASLLLLLGTPAAWWLSRGRGAARWLAWGLIAVPVVLPPAVLGVALLRTFGPSGWLPLELAFQTRAVVLAQILVGLPLYVGAAATAFRGVHDDLVLVARTLGAGPVRAWLTVAVPAAAPGLALALALAWARALGEFGATLMFAGNLPGHTRTLPIAIYTALERDLDAATLPALVLVGLAAALSLGLLGVRRWVGDPR